jgi:RNA polymerase sigma-70 factor, ECF subfamily
LNYTDEILTGIRLGDYGSFNRLFVRYYGRLCTYVEKITNNDSVSEDIVQELFIKLWTDREKIEVRENIAGYLFKSSKNAALNYLKSERNKNIALERTLFDKPNTYDDESEYDEFLSALEKCINQLPARSKQVFLLHRFDGLKQKEISEKLNISVQTIKNQIWKSLQFLKSCVELKEVL